jgi:CDP-paratose 2-epimerase
MGGFLITGGCGFVGSNVAAKLLTAGHGVTVFDDLSRVGTAENLQWLQSLGGVKFVRGDIADANAVHDIVKEMQPHAVMHLAGQVAMTTSVQDPIRDFRTNTVGTLNMLEGLRLHSPSSALLYASTNKVYGALSTVKLVEEPMRYAAPKHAQGLGEDIPLDFRTPYGCSKGAADQYVLEYARTYGLKTAVFRHSTIYGSRQRSTYDQGWVGWFCMQALGQSRDLAAPAFTISGNGKQVRDMLHVDDAVDCYLGAFGNIDSVNGQAFNIGGGFDNSSSLLELFEFLQRTLGVSLRYTKLDWRHEDQRFFVADNAKITRAIGWQPRVSKTAGVEQTLDWLGGAS